ncbi:MAG: hypothetical protein E6I16_12550 [Chloroflexi bacterium]|nr:MAG: hypothetical protein E6I16_12550 [Chloroflexota bacterium]
MPAASPPTEKRPKKRPKPPKADRDLWVFERQAFGLGYATVAGVDEAGRGPWAGPVVAGAAIMRPYFHCEGIDDSKLLTAEDGSSSGRRSAWATRRLRASMKPVAGHGDRAPATWPADRLLADRWILAA